MRRREYRCVAARKVDLRGRRKTDSVAESAGDGDALRAGDQPCANAAYHTDGSGSYMPSALPIANVKAMRRRGEGACRAARGAIRGFCRNGSEPDDSGR